MFTVYVLYSEKCCKHYTGYTSNLEQRIASHNYLSKKGWTVKFRPWILVYSEEFISKKNAMQRELELKSYQGRLFIKRIISEKYHVKIKNENEG